MPDDFVEDELEDVFSKGESESDSKKKDVTDDAKGSSADGDSGDAKDGDSPPALTQKDLEALEAKVRNEILQGDNRLLSQLAQSQKREDVPPSAPPEDEQGKKLRQLVNSLAKQAPDRVGEAIDKLVEHKMRLAEDQIVNRAMGRFNSSTASSRLRDSILQHYRDDIRNPQSEIVARGAQEKENILNALSDFMTPDQLDKFKRSSMSDQLAYAIGAALSPNVVARAEVARVKADRARREREIERLSGVASSGSVSRRQSEPAIDDGDRELAATFGIDLDDEKVRERILAAKGSVEDEFVVGGLKVGRPNVTFDAGDVD